MAYPEPSPEPVVRILHAERRTLDGRWNGDLRTACWQVWLNDDDGADVLHPGGSHRLTAGIIHVLPAAGCFALQVRGRVVQHAIGIDPGEPLRDLPRSPHPSAEIFRRPIALPAEATAAAAVRAVCAAGAHTPFWRLQAQAATLPVLVACLHLLPPSAQAELAGAAACDGPLARVLRLIDECLPTSLTVRGMAERCGLSVSHLFELFHRHTGNSPHHYLCQRRIAVAADRLRSSMDPIEVIAGQCGFSNRHHFSRVFARLMGMGPAAFRRCAQAAGRSGDGDT
jgi:AraC-like DNA-binding protein